MLANAPHAALAEAAVQADSFHQLRSLLSAGVGDHQALLKYLKSVNIAGSPDTVAFGFGSRASRWPDLTQLKVCFFDGPQIARENVMSLYGEILSYTTLSATNLGDCTGSNGDVRVSFSTGDGYWSLVGLSARHSPRTDPTIGLDGLGVTRDLDAREQGVVRHELLHSIGFEHEHQRSDVDCGYKSDEEIAALIGWTVQQVRTNFDPIKEHANDALTQFDNRSEMLYQLPSTYFVEGAESPCYIMQSNDVLSPLDVKTLQILYPKPGARLKDLNIVD